MEQRAPHGPGRWTAFLMFGFVILLTAAFLLAAGGYFWAWMTAGALLIIGGLGLVIVLARRNRGGPAV